jgi:hypothetical protein
MRTLMATALLFLGACASTSQPGSQASPPAGNSNPASAAASALDTELLRALRRQQSRIAYYKRAWGVEFLGIKPVSSGYMLSFRYRIIDATKAKPFNDRKQKAFLVDEATGIALAVPALENVGELRPGAAPEPDRTYFMVFGNPGKLVKTGSRVTLVIGNLRAEGLIVE